ncbi:acyltransferase family protein [Tropicimonas aquimaris]|uniref:Acyltransferase family protein n=1 Tax=Tropicimonas aquimaris TaxID=914152 RepID=A0ABW3IWH7_9RHOB
MSVIRYRPDIDGLRSVAVLQVVFFHYGASAVSGGFIGVDVFFVISGFLITSILRREIEDGRFSILDFFERRVLRILPALFVSMTVIMVVATLLFTPEDLKNTALSAASATLFASNVLFFLEAGYFEAAAYSKPLLHTWSLAIEEQFYIIVPILLLLLARWGRRPVIWIGGLTLLSFALSVLTTAQMASAAYYLLPWRAWELGLGALLAYGVGPKLTDRGGREAAATLGIGLILYAALTFDRTTTFPGVAALAPTLGAALILHAGRFGPTVVSRMLSSMVPVWIGKMSYSLYLWHWPVVVFFVYATMSMPDLVEATVLFILSLGLAALSLRYVERPFRRPAGQIGQNRAVFWGAGGAMAGIISLSGAVVLSNGLPGRLPDELQGVAAFVHDRDPRIGECFRSKKRDRSWGTPCIYGATDAGPATIALWGDSFGPALIPALDTAGQSHGVPVALYAHDGCPGFPDFQVYWIGHDHDCTGYLDATIPEILNSSDIQMVVFTFRAQMYAHGWVDYGMGERDRRPLLIGPRSGPLAPDANRTSFFLDRLEAAIVSLQESGKRVALVYPIPEAGTRVPDMILRSSTWGGGFGEHVLSREVYDARTAEIVAGYDRIVADHDVLPIRLDQEVCGPESCRFTLENGTPFLRDSNHLSATAARQLAHLFDPVFAGLRHDDG